MDGPSIGGAAANGARVTDAEFGGTRGEWLSLLTRWSRGSVDPDVRVFLFVTAARLSERPESVVEAVGVRPDDWTMFLADVLPDLPPASVDERAAALSAPPLERTAPTTPVDRVPAEELADVRNLLLESRANDGKRVEWMADVVARTGLFPNHLWQDLGLPDRTWLSALLNRNFPALAAANTGDMKWKKFIYKALCDRSGLSLCKAPSCAVCSDKPKCFGPEE